MKLILILLALLNCPTTEANPFSRNLRISPKQSNSCDRKHPNNNTTLLEVDLKDIFLSIGTDKEKTSKGCFPNDRLNFGVLVYNENFKIYRSSGLGKSGLKVLQEHLSRLKLDCPTKIIYMNKDGYRSNKPKKIVETFLRSVWYRYKNKTYTGNFASEQADLSEQSENSIRRHKGRCFLEGAEADPLSAPSEDLHDFTSVGDETSNPNLGIFKYKFVHPATHDVFLNGKRKGDINKPVFTGPIRPLLIEGQERLESVLKARN